ncbi:C-type lectin domain family 7 member A-like [Alligator sinensis]|uniref:C-type lectin domain family 7 member A-like n=1 Tax=Alligator sinensis TaxID=38654 RepID=A0A3Q0FUD3_ALLSI|nr:C-type lectin domain family 7 member A-like [Alligator sinensis]
MNTCQDIRDQGAGVEFGFGMSEEPTQPSLLWSPIPLVLGIMTLCLLFLITARVYGAQVPQLGRGKENLVQKVEDLTSGLTSCQNPSLPGSPTEQPQDTGEKCPVVWLAYQDRSYLFFLEKGTWEQCKSSCVSQSATLLTIESKEELDFITARSFKYAEDHGRNAYYDLFWTGLSFDSRKGMWVWEDDSTLSSGLFVLSDPSVQNYQDGACTFLQGEKVKPGGCGGTWFCIVRGRRKHEEKNKLD